MSFGATRRRAIGPRGADRRLAILPAAALAALVALAAAARGETVDDVVEALKIRDYLRATEEQCRAAAREHAERQISAIIEVRLVGRAPNADEQARIDFLSQTYAREACDLGIDQGVIQRYRAAYRAALTDAELAAALAFLSSPEGRRFAEAGLGANRAVLPLIARRQESQASRATVFLRSRLSAMLGEMLKDQNGAAPGAQ